MDFSVGHNTAQGYLWWQSGGLLHALRDCGSSACKGRVGMCLSLCYRRPDCSDRVIVNKTQKRRHVVINI